ncbi:MAG: hypothetical protein HY508_05400 [Acidobacteria bacterium]|nr:hypothetical protein [Acidobacteriota bacterium]
MGISTIRATRLHRITLTKKPWGLVDMFEYGGQCTALSHLEEITDRAIKNLDRIRTNPNPKIPAGQDGCESAILEICPVG